MADNYAAFVARLADQPTETAYNHYADKGPAGGVRRHNLALYLQRMAERGPRLLILGEAPGYRGCRITGVPFTSESILLADSSPFGLFGRVTGFRASGEGNSARREATATMLWAGLADMDVLPLLWNAFPFHPYREGRPASNRAPTVAEMAQGRWAVEALIDLFGIEQVIAVGGRANAALTRWNIPAGHVRHPSHGGKAAFREELAALLAVT